MPISRQRLHQLRNPERHQARQTVTRAVTRGKLPRPDKLVCTDCGERAGEYDHYLGYAAEHRLDVQPVCIKCHAKRFKNLRSDHRDPLPRALKFCKRCEIQLPEKKLVWCSIRCRCSYRYAYEENYRRRILAAGKRRYWAKKLVDSERTSG